MADEPAVQFLRSVLTRLRSQPWERDHFDLSRDRTAGEDARTRVATMLSPERVRGTDRDALLGLLRDVNQHHHPGNGRGVPKDVDTTGLRSARPPGR
ncbi:MAG: hypothetical protein WKF75_12425 [Singulisphaera sp.]